GGFDKTGGGKLILSKDNAYTGPTSVSAGTLQIGNGGNTGSILGSIDTANNTTVAFNRSDAYTFGGNITGDGKVVQMGAGTLTLTGGMGNTFTGGTEIESGTLNIANSFSHSMALGHAANAGYITFTGADTAKVTVNSDTHLTLVNSFRTQGTGNYSVDLNAPLDIVSVDITDKGGAFYVAPNTTMNLNVANNLGLGNNFAAGQWNDLYVENGGTFNINLANEALVMFASGIDGGDTGTLKISGTGAVELVNMTSSSQTFNMGTTEVSGSNPGDMALLWLLRLPNTPSNPRVTFSNTGAFSLTGNDSSPVSAVLMGDGIVTADTINVTNGGALMPIGVSATSASASGTLTLEAATINLTDFNLLYTAYGPQEALTYSAATPTIPDSNNSLLNLVGNTNIDTGAVYFVTADRSSFAPGDYLIISSDTGFGGGWNPGTSLTAYLDGFAINSAAGSPRGGNSQFMLGGDPNTTTGEWTAGTTNVWFTHGLNSLSMNWTGGNQDHNNIWESGDRFDSLQAGGNEHQFLSGDKVYISGTNEKFTIELPAITRTSKIVVSGLVVGQNVNRTDTSGGEYTISGEGGITANQNTAFGTFVGVTDSGDTLVPTGMLQKYGNSTLTFENTGGNLFADGIELWGGTIAFNQASQLGIDSAAAITFMGDATLKSNADVILGTSQNIVIDTGKTGAFDTNGYTALIEGNISGSISGDGNLKKTGDGTLILAGYLNSYGSTASYAGGINIDAGTLVFNQQSSGTPIDQILSGAVSGVGSLVKDGAGILTYTGNGSGFTGALTVENGTFSLRDPMVGGMQALLSASSLTLGAGATFDYQNAAAYGGSPLQALKDVTVKGLNAHIQPNTGNPVANMSNGAMTFFLPTGMDITDVMLYVHGTVDMTGVTGDSVRVLNILGGTENLQLGEKLTLINTETFGGSSLTADPKLNGSIVGARGLSLLYFLTTDDINLYLSSMPNDKVQALPEGRMAGLAFLNQADLIWGPGMYAAILETQRKDVGAVPFFATSGGFIRYNTGSHVDVDGLHILTGLAWRAPLADKKSLV
ncbi:MAG: autotransporter-associated beta strand repeat-containing protein, partial [Acidobacteria bacterium]|nr:autotransporter-associated beta strand repeat-containing protein [Acidobacteriota bacterium]